MSLYKMSDLKQKNAFNSNVRKLELELDVTKKIWIPFEDFCYKRVHYAVKQHTQFKHAKYNIIDCYNNKIDENGRGCPICDVIEKLWGDWREAKTKEDKEVVIKKINALRAEYYYMNVVDLSDPEQKFFVATFTKSKMAELEKFSDRAEISSVIWHYKKTKTGETTKYVLIEVDAEETITKLKKNLEVLSNREYDNGGPCELEKALIRKTSKEEYMKMLDPDDEGGESETLEEDLSENKQPKLGKKDKKEEKPKTEILEDENLSLEDLDEKPKDKKPDLKPDTKKTSLEDESLSLDDIGLDDLKLEDEPLKEKKKLKIEPAMVKEKINDKSFISALSAFLVKNKKMEVKGTYKETAIETFGVVKKLGSVEITEDDGIPF